MDTSMIKQHLYLATLLIIFSTSYTFCDEEKETPPPIDKRPLHLKMLEAICEKSKIVHNERKIAQQNFSALKGNKRFFGLISLIIGTVASASGVGSFLIYKGKILPPVVNNDQIEQLAVYSEGFRSFATALRVLSTQQIETGTYWIAGTSTVITLLCVWRFIANWTSETTEEYNCICAAEHAAAYSEILADLHGIINPKPIIPASKKSKDSEQNKTKEQGQTPETHTEQIPPSMSVTTQITLPRPEQNNGAL